MSKAVIVAACRTAIGSFGGALTNTKATALGALAVKEACRRAKLEPSQVDEVILGNVIAAGLGLNPARVAALESGEGDGGGVGVGASVGSGVNVGPGV